ncbi:hypothetical protein ABZW18_19330 [Streptomyces sp. NPDC004647]|uniref:hypothetical protein n=1 Tax=Streptomyces sp. NPDC004647 TaxID=3154671 RepID=UPI0033BA4CDF
MTARTAMTGIQDKAQQGHSHQRPGPSRPSPLYQGKTSFDDIYDQPDPRDYFRGLRPLEYQIPHHAQRIFQRLLPALGAVTGRDQQVRVLDVCCSYGINAALLNHDVTLDDLYHRYTDPRAAALSRDELIERDRAFYARNRLPGAAHMTGLDAARNAVAYARAVGLLDEGFGEDLELTDPSPALVRALGPVELITVTGGVGYVTSQTFDKLLSHIEGPVWVAAFVLRTVDYGSLADTLARHGLVTQRATSRTFLQRRFSDAREQQNAIEAVLATDRSPEGKETDGFYHSELYLSRPAEHAAAFPADEILDRAIH